MEGTEIRWKDERESHGCEAPRLGCGCHRDRVGDGAAVDSSPARCGAAVTVASCPMWRGGGFLPLRPGPMRRGRGGGFLPDAARRPLLARLGCGAAVASCGPGPAMRRGPGGGFRVLPDAAAARQQTGLIGDKLPVKLEATNLNMIESQSPWHFTRIRGRILSHESRAGVDPRLPLNLSARASTGCFSLGRNPGGIRVIKLLTRRT